VRVPLRHTAPLLPTNYTPTPIYTASYCPSAALWKLGSSTRFAGLQGAAEASRLGVGSKKRPSRQWAVNEGARGPVIFRPFLGPGVHGKPPYHRPQVDLDALPNRGRGCSMGCRALIVEHGGSGIFLLPLRQAFRPVFSTLLVVSIQSTTTTHFPMVSNGFSHVLFYRSEH
jgi:hypothetical protein